MLLDSTPISIRSELEQHNVNALKMNTVKTAKYQTRRSKEQILCWKSKSKKGATRYYARRTCKSDSSRVDDDDICGIRVFRF